MAGADSMVDAESAVKDYLDGATVNARITNNAETIQVYLHEFNSDSALTSIMVRDAGGSSDAYMQLDYPTIQVWVRSSDPDDAKTVIARVDNELQQFGPEALNASVFCLSMLRNTGRQRLDDIHNKLVQYFIIYNAVMRRSD